jgi:hypothetical protein
MASATANFVVALTNVTGPLLGGKTGLGARFLTKSTELTVLIPIGERC